MTIPLYAQIVVAVCVLGCAVLSLAAAVGLVRFPDLLSRMHASSKPQVLGLFLILVAIVVAHPNWQTLTTAALVMGIQMLTSPLAVHMIGRAGYRTKQLRRSMLYRDELAEAITHAEARESARRAEAAKQAKAAEDA
ncbi:monovalent cation/H(+) antiporter subunit G [Brevibacterium sp. 50QC2O2]|jgi:multicomponent Na+:H+ antiporter subunit G|uniref:monovalent cation/H(+) antiporter subunit G n=1 Tax=Brevibacterium TaxID=1696 RepID=UPI00211C4415|nr:MULTISPECIES: monovalent cation/H(+) antiporter subunit G [unclassified Brevibacterium]MCQ9369285.1 monovalent cation/H(+) antiporter subunit G [Brevibacterium sp. 91QC2O2]MCQ9386667.1 monovalent cation/H(+) antiporter subunit G [Brevibacterium sp. 68QC2CO]MCQ9388680.1 monovalent cation/H(+) antiporter subunit G [Brevibacterium sp. 50QC2O2]